MEVKQKTLKMCRQFHRDEKGMGTTAVLIACGVLIFVWAIFSLVMGGIGGHMENKRQTNRARDEAYRKAQMPSKPIDRKAKGYQVKY